ncbi:hypothetical protein BHE74_00047563 [Ensete ventricosum]|nr:hypothetical protein BHE74_00047563 [Ensete ventricosum]RZS11412.1 hypothetical protein BHM03_00042744 [Ensete ventricosum]
MKARSLQKQQQNGHALTSKLAYLLDPEASWDKVCLESLDIVPLPSRSFEIKDFCIGHTKTGSYICLLGFLYMVWHTFEQLLSAEPHGAPSFDPMK